MKKTFLLLYLLLMLFLPLTGKGAAIKIVEVNFKNKESDWIKIRNNENGEATNLKGLQLEDDKVFKTLEKDFMLPPGKELILYFKQEKEDDPAHFIFYTDHSGLTATTEQIIIKESNGKVIDAVCWSSGKDTEKELKDLAKLYESGEWNSKESKDCIDSKTIKTNQSIIRKVLATDTNSKEDWSVKEETETAEKITKENKSKESNKKKSYQNGNLSKGIIINEIFPAPSKESGEEEWIELHNQETHDIALGNWLLDDDEKGSKPFIIPDHYIIKAKNFLVLSAKETKLSLGNSKDKVKILDYEGKTIDEIVYENAQKDKSYSRIIIQDGNKKTAQWFWLDKTSRNKPNPNYGKLTGTIATNAQFTQEYSFLLKSLDNKTCKIIFDEEIIAAPLAKATFIEGSQLQILAENINADQWRLKKYETLSMPKKKETNSFLNLLVALGMSLGIPLVFIGKALYQKGKKTQ